MSNERFGSVWDAIEDTQAQAENMRLRSVLMMALKDHIARARLSQSQAAKMFGVTGTAGLTLALCRRARAVFWAGVGAMCMVVMKKGKRTAENGDNAGSDTKQSFTAPPPAL